MYLWQTCRSLYPLPEFKSSERGRRLIDCADQLGGSPCAERIGYGLAALFNRIFKIQDDLPVCSVIADRKAGRAIMLVVEAGIARVGHASDVPMRDDIVSHGETALARVNLQARRAARPGGRRGNDGSNHAVGVLQQSRPVIFRLDLVDEGIHHAQYPIWQTKEPCVQIDIVTGLLHEWPATIDNPATAIPGKVVVGLVPVKFCSPASGGHDRNRPVAYVHGAPRHHHAGAERQPGARRHARR